MCATVSYKYIIHYVGVRFPDPGIELDICDSADNSKIRESRNDNLHKIKKTCDSKDKHEQGGNTLL